MTTIVRKNSQGVREWNLILTNEEISVLSSLVLMGMLNRDRLVSIQLAGVANIALRKEEAVNELFDAVEHTGLPGVNCLKSLYLTRVQVIQEETDKKNSL